MCVKAPHIIRRTLPARPRLEPLFAAGGFEDWRFAFGRAFRYTFASSLKCGPPNEWLEPFLCRIRNREEEGSSQEGLSEIKDHRNSRKEIGAAFAQWNLPKTPLSLVQPAAR